MRPLSRKVIYSGVAQSERGFGYVSRMSGAIAIATTLAIINGRAAPTIGPLHLRPLTWIKPIPSKGRIEPGPAGQIAPELPRHD